MGWTTKELAAMGHAGRSAGGRKTGLWGAVHGLSRPMRWALGSTLAATVLVLLLPPPDTASEPRSLARAEPGGKPGPAGVAAAASGAAGRIWAAWKARQTPTFPEAESDPFNPGAEQAPKPAPEPPPAPMPLAGPPPPPPPAPAPQTNFRVQGWFALAGELPRVVLSDGKVDMVARQGLELPDGFAVRSLDSRRVVLRHNATQTEYALPLPESLPAGSPNSAAPR